MLHLYDTAEGGLRPFTVRDQGRVSIYCCGPTVYDLPHLGHGRFVLVWDVLRRYLSFSGYEVTFVSNITDIDDNIIARATEEHRSEPEVAAEFEARWWEAMDALGVLRPNATPHATQFVAGMIELIERLFATGKAYATSDGVYLDTSTVPDYGLLAGQPLESLREGARVERVEEKRSPLDFVLWKSAKPGEPKWDAPFGAGRPGWHTECVVMSLALLGEGFDLHVGGQDLRFPHHENERAQAVADHKVFSTHWAHNGWVMSGGDKMSKSLKNFTSLTDLLARHDQRAYRLLCLQAHYRGPVEVTPETIDQAERTLARLDALARRFSLAPLDTSVPLVESDFGGLDEESLAAFHEAMDDDMFTPKVFADLAGIVSRANAFADEGNVEEGRKLAETVAVLLGALGLTLDGSLGDIDDASAALAKDRDSARASKDWAAADRLRDELVALGWTVEDGPDGTVIRR